MVINIPILLRTLNLDIYGITIGFNFPNRQTISISSELEKEESNIVYEKGLNLNLFHRLVLPIFLSKTPFFQQHTFLYFYHVSSFTCHIISRNSYYITSIIACLVIEDINTSFKEKCACYKCNSTHNHPLENTVIKCTTSTIIYIMNIFHITNLTFQG